MWKKKLAIWLSLSPKRVVHLLIQNKILEWHLTGFGKSWLANTLANLGSFIHFVLILFQGANHDHQIAQEKFTTFPMSLIIRCSHLRGIKPKMILERTTNSNRNPYAHGKGTISRSGKTPLIDNGASMCCDDDWPIYGTPCSQYKLQLLAVLEKWSNVLYHIQHLVEVLFTFLVWSPLKKSINFMSETMNVVRWRPLTCKAWATCT